MKYFFGFYLLLFISGIMISGRMAFAADVVVRDETDSTVRPSQNKMEYGEGSSDRVPSSLRYTQPGYDCPAGGCKSESIQKSTTEVKPVDSEPREP